MYLYFFCVIPGLEIYDWFSLDWTHILGGTIDVIVLCEQFHEKACFLHI